MLTLFSRKPAAIAAIGAAAIALAACGQNGGTEADGTSSAGEASGADVIDTAATGALSEMSLGSDDAPVTVIEYASVTCPACANFHQGVFPEIKENYIDTGKVRFVFREFPTAPVDRSVAGSMLARCATDKGGDEAYFLILDSLFKTQQTWIYGDTRAELLKIAAQAGMDEEAFDACVGRKDVLEVINAKITEGSERYDVKSTPSFIVNGTLRHFSTAEDMSKALDDAIAKAES